MKYLLRRSWRCITLFFTFIFWQEDNKGPADDKEKNEATDDEKKNVPEEGNCEVEEKEQSLDIPAEQEQEEKVEVTTEAKENGSDVDATADAEVITALQQDNQ